MRVIAHGIDAVEIARIEQMLDEHGERFIERCFTDGERAYAESGRESVGGVGGRRSERYAARFACKEAVFKALGTGWRSGMSWRDVEVTHQPLGQPAVTLSGQCLELATKMRITHWHISLSHTDTLALASVIACGE